MLNGWEIVLAYANNLQVLFIVGAIAGLITAGVVAIASSGSADSYHHEAPDKDGLRFARRVAALAGVLAILGAAPSVEDLWKVRLGLLKLDLASPANVQAAGGHIEVVVKALECKYLQQNCPKEAKP